MSLFLVLLMIFFTGVLVGHVFFWGLWETVHKMNQVRYPAALILGSLLLRFCLVLIALYLLAQKGSWEHLLVAAIGFALSGLFFVYRVQRNKKQDR